MITNLKKEQRADDSKRAYFPVCTLIIEMTEEMVAHSKREQENDDFVKEVKDLMEKRTEEIFTLLVFYFPRVHRPHHTCKFSTVITPISFAANTK